MSRSPSLPEGFFEIDFKHPYRTSGSPRGRMRCLAMLHLQSGKTVEQVADIVQQSRPTIHTWIRWIKEGGLARLVDDVQGRGRKPKLSGDDGSRLKEMILQAHEKRKGGRIIGKDVQAIIKEHWGADYCLSNIYVILKRVGLVWITSRSKHPKVDIELIDDFKKNSTKKSKKSSHKIKK